MLFRSNFWPLFLCLWFYPFQFAFLTQIVLYGRVFLLCLCGNTTWWDFSGQGLERMACLLYCKEWASGSRGGHFQLKLTLHEIEGTSSLLKSLSAALSLISINHDEFLVSNPKLKSESLICPPLYLITHEVWLTWTFWNLWPPFYQILINLCLD